MVIDAPFVCSRLSNIANEHRIASNDVSNGVYNLYLLTQTVMIHSRAFIEGSIGRVLFQFSAPVFGMHVLQSMMISVNSFWIGRKLGEAALAAISNAQILTMLVVGFSLGGISASTILVGQYVGAGNISEAKRVLATSVALFSAVSLAMAVAGLLLSEVLLKVAGAPLDSISSALAYMRVFFLTLPSLYLFAFVIAILLSSGDTKTPLYFMLLAVTIEFVLNPIFIMGINPVPSGVAGSAFATFVAETTSLVAIIAYLYHRRHPLFLNRSELMMSSVDMAIVRTLLYKGTAIGAQVLVVPLSGALMIALVNRFGIDTIAAFGALLQIWNYIQIPAIAIGTAVATLVALNAGGQHWERVRSIAAKGAIYSALVSLLAVLSLHAFDTHLLALFLPPKSQALHIATHINWVVAWSFVPLGVSVVLFSAVRGTGVVMVPLLAQILTLLVVRFPLAASLLDRLNADAIWWSLSISSTLTALLSAIYFKYGRWCRGTPLNLART